MKDFMFPIMKNLCLFFVFDWGNNSKCLIFKCFINFVSCVSCTSESLCGDVWLVKNTIFSDQPISTSVQNLRLSRSKLNYKKRKSPYNKLIIIYLLLSQHIIKRKRRYYIRHPANISFIRGFNALSIHFLGGMIIQ